MQFSIIIPLYNKEPYIKRALDSVRDQTIRDFEIIVIDDGSTDKSVDVVKGFDDARIRLIIQKNSGVSIARNRGINEAKSELIAFLDADDEWMPDYLETILRLKDKFPKAGLYATSMKSEYFDNALVNLDDELRSEIPFEGIIPNFFKICATGNWIFTTSSVTVPKYILSDIGGFQIDSWWGEDFDLFGRIALKYPIAYSSHVCSIYYDVPNSSMKKRKNVPIHPFMKNNLKIDNIPQEIRNDVIEYIRFLEMFTAKHNIKAGNLKPAISLVFKKDTKMSYRKLLIRIMVTTKIKRYLKRLN